MKKLKLLLFLVFASGLLVGTNAQDTIKGLIFSEHRFGDPHHGYLEIANVGTETIDLSKVTIGDITNQTLVWDVDQWRLPGLLNINRIAKPEGFLAPGETWMWMGVSDRFAPNTQLPDHRLDLLPLADMYIMSGNAFGVTDTIIPEWQMWGDSASINAAMGWNWGSHPYVLFAHLDNGDSVMIDQVLMNLNDNNQAVGGYTDVAGVEEATRYYTMVRKASITAGNMDWENQKGATADDSEWIIWPNQPGTSRRSFTTVKNHGDFHIDVTSADVDIDVPNAKMTVPWGIYKGDSILAHLDIGPGMGWGYVEDDDFADSTHTIMQNGDTLIMYAAGNVLEQINFEIVVLDPAPDQATVYPMRKVVGGGSVWYNFNISQWEWTDADIWVTPYYVTINQGVDTIGNVPYATRVDSLFKYLEKAPDANWEIVWVDGEEHADLRNGDILKVTGSDGSTVKEYYIDVLDYIPSDLSALGAITWPDKEEFLEGWMGDTIPLFSSIKTSYTITVPYGSKNVPALVAHPQDINADVDVARAVSLTGSLEARSTVFTVTAQDGSQEIYTVTFELEKDPTKVQIWADATPFFSESATHQRSAMNYLEIVNPGNSDMDLSEYLIMRSTAVNPAEALSALVPEVPTDADFQFRYNSYVPGFSYREDTINWLLEPGILHLDPNVDPVVEPGGVFVISATWADREQYYTDFHRSIIDRRWDDVTDEVGVSETNTAPVVRSANALYMFKIVGDSVLDGTKPVGDPADYELVDVLGDPIDDLAWTVAGRNVTGLHRGRIRPKPYVYTGNRSLVECAEAFGTSPDTTDWVVETYNNELAAQDMIPDLIGSHTMDAVTVYLSTITSSVYLCSDGYSMDETIQGDLASTTVEAFFGNVDQADPMQVLSVQNASGTEKDLTDPVAGGDVLVVVSADGVNTSKYTLVNTPLDTDAVLTTEDTELTISHSGDVGTITGVVYGSLLKDLVAAVNVPALAVMNVIDADGKLVPMQMMNYDSVKVETLVGDGIYFEVVAQDLVTIITYKLEAAALSSDAFVISSLYEVSEEDVEISGLADGTTIGLLFNNIEVVKGADATVLSKLGHERMDGFISYDDVLKVVSEDGTNTKVYFLTFLNETNPDANNAPEIELAFSDTTFADPGTIMLMATATDDGLPPPANLTSLWEVSSGTAANVVIENADQLSSNVTFNEKGSYTLTLSVSDGALTSQVDVTVLVGTVGIDQALVPAMLVYPNPASDKLTLELTNMPGRSSFVSIFSITGSAVYNAKLSSAKMEIDLSYFEAGLYLIKVESKGQSFTQRVEIHK